MTDHCSDQLSAYLDGELAPDRRVELEAHLSICDQCLKTLDELRGVVARAQALDDTPPTLDLWSGIAARIGAAAPQEPGGAESPGLISLPRRRFSLSVVQLLAASLAVMLISGGSVWLALSRGPALPVVIRQDDTGIADGGGQVARGGGEENGGPARVSRAGQPAVTTGELRVANFADREFEAAVADLERVLEEGRGRLDPATIKTIEESLAVVDAALAQARRAVAADPASIYLNEHLAATMRRKLQLLRLANSLATSEA